MRETPWMTPWRGWAILLVLSIALLGETVICGMRISVLLGELRTCQHQLPPQPSLEQHPVVR